MPLLGRLLRLPSCRTDRFERQRSTSGVAPITSEPATGTTKKRMILIYNSAWPTVPDPFPPCPAECEITFDVRLLRQCAAVVFHIPTLQNFPSFQKPGWQKWIAWSMESDVNHPLLKSKHFMSKFDLTMTYRLDCDIPVPYFDLTMLNDLLTPPQEKTETALAVCFFSSSIDRSGRTSYVRELMKYIEVDSYGRILNNRSLDSDEGRKTKLETIARYKFTLAFENSISMDYVTEKFFDPLTTGSVPVYLGAPNVSDFAPADNCFINVAEFHGPRDLARYLQKLNDHPALYDEYLAWKEKGLNERFVKLVEPQRVHSFCRLCMRLRES